LNASLLKDEVNYLAGPIYDIMGFTPDIERVKVNPLPYMNKYIDSSEIQAAAQEIQITNYRIGAIVDDTDGITFDEIY
jgi:ribonucleoside-diphosphate reductase beta chain